MAVIDDLGIDLAKTTFYNATLISAAVDCLWWDKYNTNTNAQAHPCENVRTCAGPTSIGLLRVGLLSTRRSIDLAMTTFYNASSIVSRSRACVVG